MERHHYKMKIFFIFQLALLLTVSNVSASKYYWQNNGGSWSDITHWFNQPIGGVQYGVVPGLADI